MEPGDSDIEGKFNADSENNHYNEEYSHWKKKATGKFGSNLFKKPDGIPLSRFGIGFLILAILLILLFTRSHTLDPAVYQKPEFHRRKQNPGFRKPDDKA